jgi:hypothetical protein
MGQILVDGVKAVSLNNGLLRIDCAAVGPKLIPSNGDGDARARNVPGRWGFHRHSLLTLAADYAASTAGRPVRLTSTPRRRGIASPSLRQTLASVNNLRSQGRFGERRR